MLSMTDDAIEDPLIEQRVRQSHWLTAVPPTLTDLAAQKLKDALPPTSEDLERSLRDIADRLAQPNRGFFEECVERRGVDGLAEFLWEATVRPKPLTGDSDLFGPLIQQLQAEGGSPSVPDNADEVILPLALMLLANKVEIQT